MWKGDISMWRFCNDDVKFIRKGGRKALRISQEEFRKKLVCHVLTKSDVIERLEEDCTKDQISQWKNGEEVPSDILRDMFVYFGYYIGDNESDQICKDLSKLAGMDFENVAVDAEMDEGASHLLGFKVLKNGLPIFGMTSGLDGVFPVYFCIYWDGKNFRGYIPTYGNSFNKNYMCVMGFDKSEYEEYLEENKQKGSPIPDHKNFRNDKAIEEDICSRITII